MRASVIVQDLVLTINLLAIRNIRGSVRMGLQERRRLAQSRALRNAHSEHDGRAHLTENDMVPCRSTVVIKQSGD